MGTKDILLAPGIALASAVGLRVFVPLLVLSLAAYVGKVPLAPAFAWLGTAPAVPMLAVAAIVETTAYCLSRVDHLRDVIAAPGAVLAGTFMVAAPLWELPPLNKWAARYRGGRWCGRADPGVSRRCCGRSPPS